MRGVGSMGGAMWGHEVAASPLWIMSPHCSRFEVVSSDWSRFEIVSPDWSRVEVVFSDWIVLADCGAGGLASWFSRVGRFLRRVAQARVVRMAWRRWTMVWMMRR